MAKILLFLALCAIGSVSGIPVARADEEGGTFCTLVCERRGLVFVRDESECRQATIVEESCECCPVEYHIQRGDEDGNDDVGDEGDDVNELAGQDGDDDVDEYGDDEEYTTTTEDSEVQIDDDDNGDGDNGEDEGIDDEDEDEEGDDDDDDDDDDEDEDEDGDEDEDDDEDEGEDEERNSWWHNLFHGEDE